SWSATGLPTGLSVSSSGLISGSPSAGGAFSVVISVTDASNPHQNASVTLPLTIQAAALRITTGSLPTGPVNSSYSAQVLATGGVQPYQWSATGLPLTLSINSSTGVISGTPTLDATYSVTVKVT